MTNNNNKINLIVNTILYIKKNASFEKDWIHIDLLYAIINDIYPIKSNKEKTKIAIKISEILGKEYGIYGWD